MHHPVHRTVRMDGHLDLPATLGVLRTGRADPTMRLTATTLLRATRTPDGVATVRVEVEPGGARLHASAVGPGARRALDEVPDLVGAHDDRSGFDPAIHEVVARFDHRLPGLRLPRTGRILDVLAPTVLAQRVTGSEAVRAFRFLVEAAGERAPGLAGAPDLLVPPSADWWAHTPTWQYTAAGVDVHRARTLITTHRRIDRLEEAVAMPSAAARDRLTALPGMGPWTAAIVARLARGDPDEVEVGDFHLPNVIAWHLAREPRANDARMLDLLEPFAGHRGRVVRLCELVGGPAPSRGPRLAPRRFGARTSRRPRRTS